MKIPVTFLGTGQAVPTAKRNHTAVLMQHGAENILIDCGEGTQRQFRKAHINPCKLTRILITHWHGDHVFGIPGLLQTLALNNYNKVLYVYGPRGTKRFLSLMYHLFVFKEKIKIAIKEINSGKVFETPDIIAEAVQMNHGAPCLAYSITEKSKVRIDKTKAKRLGIPEGPLFGELQKGRSIKHKGRTIKPRQVTYRTQPKKIAVIMDTKINPGCQKIAEGADLLISESTFLEDSENGKRLAEEYRHLTAKQAGEIAKKAKVKQLVLAHLSQRYEANEKPILDEARHRFKNTLLAQDLMKIEV